MMAVIDIGTNTFHLLIANVTSVNSFDIIYRESRFVRIAKDGVHPISHAAIKRAFDCLEDFQLFIQKYHVTHVRVVATEGLRSASNGAELVEQIRLRFGFEVVIISGEEEANLIFEGTIRAIPHFEEPYLIMDIGGGSVEFILARGKEKLWSNSYKIGVQYLYHRYNDSDPINAITIEKIFEYLDSELSALHQCIKQFNPTRLVGSSGSFETLAALAGKDDYSDNHVIIPSETFHRIFKRIVFSSLSERYRNPSIPNDRAELIVIGFLLVHYILRAFEPPEIVVSAYALREGLIFGENLD